MAWARRDDGLYCSTSTDGGLTWDSTSVVPIAPFRRGYSPRPMCQLADGTLLLALASHDARGALYVVRSTDRGKTWHSPPVVVSDRPPLAEPTICVCPSGRLLVLSRHDASGFVYQHVSSDGGSTWTPPRRLPLWGYPAHLVPLADGRVPAIYGVPLDALQYSGMPSEDEGDHWDHADELCIRDGLPTPNHGYPTAVELPDGRPFAAYYGEDEWA